MLIEADISPAQAAKFGGGTNPRFTWNQLINNGVKPLDNADRFAGNMPVFIVDYPFYLPGSVDFERLYRVGTKTFTAVLRYNSLSEPVLKPTPLVSDTPAAIFTPALWLSWCQRLQ